VATTSGRIELSRRLGHGIVQQHRDSRLEIVHPTVLSSASEANPGTARSAFIARVA